MLAQSPIASPRQRSVEGSHHRVLTTTFFFVIPLPMSMTQYSPGHVDRQVISQSELSKIGAPVEWVMTLLIL